MMTNEWYGNYDEITTFGKYLVGTQVWSAVELQYYYEKPWKWDNEYKEWKGEEE